MQVALASAGVIFAEASESASGSPLSACALPGPWQLSQPCVAAGVRSLKASAVHRALVGLIVVTAQARALADVLAGWAAAGGGGWRPRASGRRGRREPVPRTVSTSAVVAMRAGETNSQGRREQIESVVVS